MDNCPLHVNMYTNHVEIKKCLAYSCHYDT